MAREVPHLDRSFAIITLPVNLLPPRTLLATTLVLVLAAMLPAAASAAPAPFDAPDDTGFSPPGTPSRFPSIAGVPQPGGVLTGDRGAWASGITLKSEWLRCSVAAKTCQTTDDTDLSYTATSADAGLVIKLRVVATNPGLLGLGGGTRTEDAQSAPIVGATLAAPRNLAPPKILGTVQEGQKLKGSPGQWTGAVPIGFNYGWFACTAGDCTSVSTSQHYTPARADVGKKLILSVLGLNAAGSSSRTVTSKPVARKAARLTRLAPFPRLVIGGRVAGSVTAVSSFRIIRVPRGSTVTTSCTGRGCPYRKGKVKTRRSTTVRLRKLERRLRAGLTIVVTVRKGNSIGKYTRLRTRRGTAPSRIDRCVRPGSSRPVACG